jgi:murein L,D-transpeptidase YcbB/YkuD
MHEHGTAFAQFVKSPDDEALAIVFASQCAMLGRASANAALACEAHFMHDPPMHKFIALVLTLSGAAHAAPDEAALVQSVYAHSNSRLLWSMHAQPTKQAGDLGDLLRTVDSYGLRPGDYGMDLITARAGGWSAETPDADWSQYDFVMTRAAVRLITHLHYGRIDPRSAGFELPEPRTDLDVAATVAALASTADVAGTVTAAEPRFLHYALLKRALSRYRGLAADPTLTQLPGLGRKALRAGDPYAGAAALRKLLAAEGDLVAAGERAAVAGDRAAVAGDRVGDDQTLDPALCEALQRFQARHGLKVDGVLNAATFAALTTPIARRVRQIELTLERWRWLPAFRAPPIIVNIPEFKLFAFKTMDDRAASILQMPVIVGQAYRDKQTPIFIGDLKYVVFRPYWDIPRTIMLREMLPKMQAHADYAQRNHLEIVDGEGDDANIVTSNAEGLAALAAGTVRLRQQPGDDNALGLIKFLFPNAHNVYLHSTPAHKLFAASRRAFSHGCIRVSDPVALAVHVLRNAAQAWDADQIDAAMHNSEANNARVALREPIPVMIFYITAMASEAGPVLFFDDIYGHDSKLEALLHLAPVNSAATIR